MIALAQGSARRSARPATATPRTPALMVLVGASKPRLGQPTSRRPPLRGGFAWDEAQRLLEDATRHADGMAWLIAHATRIPLLSADDERALATAARAGDRGARERLALANLRLVIRLARNMSHAEQSDLELADLVQEGVVGLLRAVERFDPTTGFRFTTYATWWIGQALHRALADRGQAIRLPVYSYERRRRLLRMRGALLKELAREPSLDELVGAYATDQARREARREAHRAALPTNTQAAEQTGKRAHKDGARLPMTREEASLLLALSKPPLSLDKPVNSTHSGHGGAAGDDELTLGGLVADPASLGAFDAREESESAQWMLEVARYALRDDPRAYQIFVWRALHSETLSLDDIGQHYGVSRERIRQIEESANTRVRRALVACGMTPPKPLNEYEPPFSERRKLARERRAESRRRAQISSMPTSTQQQSSEAQ